MTSSRKRLPREQEAFDTLLNSRTARPTRSVAQQMARIFRCCDTDQRLELLKAILGQANDDDLHGLRDEYRGKRSRRRRATKRTPYMDDSRCSQWERSKEAWLVLEGYFYRNSTDEVTYRARGEKIAKLPTKEGLNGILELDSNKMARKEVMKLDAQMVDGLVALFENRGQYVSKLCKCLGLEIEHL